MPKTFHVINNFFGKKRFAFFGQHVLLILLLVAFKHVKTEKAHFMLKICVLNDTFITRKYSEKYAKNTYYRCHNNVHVFKVFHVWEEKWAFSV